MKRIAIGIGMALGAVWAVAIVLLPLRLDLPFVPPAFALPVAFLVPGLVMAAMIGVMAARRFFSTALMDGAAPLAGSHADIDERVLRNTGEQMVLALLIWPFIGFNLGGVSIIALGIGSRWALAWPLRACCSGSAITSRPRCVRSDLRRVFTPHCSAHFGLSGSG